MSPETPGDKQTRPPDTDVTRPQESVTRRAAPNPAQEEPGRQPGSQHVTFQTPPEEPLTRAFLGNSILSSVAAACLWERGRGIGEQTLGLLVPRSSSGREGSWGVRTGVAGGLCGRPVVSWWHTGVIVTHRLALLPVACFCICRELGSPGGWAVKTLSAMQETRVPSPAGEDPLEEARQPTPVSLPGGSHGQRRPAGCSSWGREESDTTEVLSTHQEWVSHYSRVRSATRGPDRVKRQGGVWPAQPGSGFQGGLWCHGDEPRGPEGEPRRLYLLFLFSGCVL